MSGFALGVAASLIAAGLIEAGKITRDTVQEELQERKFSTELDTIETRFATALRDNIADIESRRDTEALTDAVDQWGPVVRELYGLEEAAEVDGVDRILFTSEAEAVKEITAAIGRATRYDLADKPKLEDNVRVAVVKSYRESLSTFAESVSDSPGEQFLVESQTELLEHLREQQRTLDELQDQFSRRRYNLHPGNEAGRERVAENIERDELDEQAEQKVEYVPRPELVDHRDDESVLLLGAGGSGKTRSLVELVRRHEDVAHIVHPRDAFDTPSEAYHFATEEFEGDVLLVWDDIHGANPGDKNKVVRKALSELRDILGPESELHVLATARVNKGPVPGDPESDDGLWRNVEAVEIEGLGQPVLEDLIEEASDAYDVTLSEDDDIPEKFLRRTLQAEPTPMYVTSVLANAGDELTESDIRELPEGTVKIWEKNFDGLDGSAKDILQSMKVLGELAPGRTFPEPLVRGVYSEVVGGDDSGFRSSLDTVGERHWLIEDEDEECRRYGTHDVKRAAIEQDPEFRYAVSDISAFLTERSPRHFNEVDSEMVRILHGRFAKQTERFDWRVETAKEHYQYILDNIDEEDVTTLVSLGELLAENGEDSEAKRRFTQAINATSGPALVYVYSMAVESLADSYDPNEVQDWLDTLDARAQTAATTADHHLPPGQFLENVYSMAITNLADSYDPGEVEDWLDTLDARAQTAATTADHHSKPGPFLANVYSMAIKKLADSYDPGEVQHWLDTLDSRAQTAATTADHHSKPGQFLANVYSMAIKKLADSYDPHEVEDWLDALDARAQTVATTADHHGLPPERFLASTYAMAAGHVAPPIPYVDSEWYVVVWQRAVETLSPGELEELYREYPTILAQKMSNSDEFSARWFPWVVRDAKQRTLDTDDPPTEGQETSCTVVGVALAAVTIVIQTHHPIAGLDNDAADDSTAVVADIAPEDRPTFESVVSAAAAEYERDESSDAAMCREFLAHTYATTIERVLAAGGEREAMDCYENALDRRSAVEDAREYSLALHTRTLSVLGGGASPTDRPAFHDRLLDATTDELPYASLAPAYLDRLADSDEHGQAWLAWLVEDAVERTDDESVLIRLTADAVHHIWQETPRLGTSDAFERVVAAAECLAESDPGRFERVASGVEQRLDEEHLNAMAGLEWDQRLDY